MKHWPHWSSYAHALGRRLRQVRLARGLSQARLAELAGLSRNQVSNLERNENNRHGSIDPVISTIYRLAVVLDIPPSKLLPASGEKVGQFCPPGSNEGPALRPFSEAFITLAEPGEAPEYAAPAGED
ncbi:XRE family transcriptional regulator [Corynebacterium yudongzhengii]|uniref:XRE family transcriptional regulator n=1 Tax=Corynebacterium yudongzhengii TaxID=2080740 RepID=A0A2U1T725_9CORY|nr:helix-turn-helix transcriptional regulator [Corynebacterium yudongzhengii]AWB81354.1 XRE family transcriptional regulator [Corynebacterium yudongzhengii]PWC01797.1 XRE family transcriptional regulator [Corynebacterium yudongzhengii]